MLRRILPLTWGRRAFIELRPQSRTSTYFCFDTVMPVIPACYWSTLPNGFRVITEQTVGPLACVTLFAEAGPRYEAACNHGACHFFEHMAFRGLSDLPRCAFEETIRELGAHMTVNTDREYQTFVCNCPHGVVQCVINIFYRMISDLACDPAEIECAKMEVFREMEEAENDPKQLCMHYMQETAFQGTPLGRSPIGPWDNYRRFDGNFLKRFVAQHYQPFRLVLSVSSCFSHHEVVCMAQQNFGLLKETTTDVVYWPCRFTGSMVRYRNDDLPFCHVALAVEVGGYSHKDYLTLLMMKNILGKWDESQWQGYNTWPMLAHACALSHLCYRYEAFYMPFRDVGLFGVYFVINKDDDCTDAFLMIQDQLMNLCVTTTFPEVQRAMSWTKQEMAKSVDGCTATCQDMAIQMMNWGHRKNLLELNAQIDLIKQIEVRDVADHVIYDCCPAVAAVGPTESVPDYTRIRADMYWLRI